jgi:hypothetical protein
MCSVKSCNHTALILHRLTRPNSLFISSFCLHTGSY